MSKWIAEFDLEDGDTMPEHMDLEYKGAKIDFYCKSLEQEPFINKPCVSEKVCEHDKNEVLDKIRAEIEQNVYPIVHGVNSHELGMTLYGILQVIDKYKAESED